MIPAFPPHLTERYEPLEVLGRGTSATVLRARQRDLDRTVVLKVFHDPEGQRSPQRVRVLREARLLVGMRHPRVVSLLDFGDQDGTIHFAYPDHGAEALSTRMKPGEPWDPARVVRLLDDVLAGLAHLHAAGIVHRDLKPANIVLDPEGRAQLIDLGLAKDLDASVGLTATQEFVGTPLYAAPDQALESSDCEPRDDLYALGVVAYELSTGENPFRSATLGGIFDRHVSYSPPSLDRLDPAIPSGLARLVDALLAKCRDDRPRDAEEARARLAPVLAEMRSGTTPPTSQAGPPVRSVATLALEPRVGDPAHRAGSGPAFAAAAAAAAALALVALGLLARFGPGDRGNSGSGPPTATPLPTQASAEVAAPAALMQVAARRALDRLPVDPARSHAAFWELEEARAWLRSRLAPGLALGPEERELLVDLDRSLGARGIEPVFEPFLAIEPLGPEAAMPAGAIAMATERGLGDLASGPASGWLAAAGRAADQAAGLLEERRRGIAQGDLGPEAAPELDLVWKTEALVGGKVGLASLARRAADGPGTRAAWASWLEPATAALRRMLAAVGRSFVEEPATRERAALLALAWCEGLDPLFAGAFGSAPPAAILGIEPGRAAHRLVEGILLRETARAQARAGFDPAGPLAAAARALELAAGLGTRPGPDAGTDSGALDPTSLAARLAGRALAIRMRLAIRFDLARENLLRLTHRGRDHQAAAGLLEVARARLPGLPPFEAALVLGEVVRALDDKKDPLRIPPADAAAAWATLGEVAARLSGAERNLLEALLHPLRL